MDLRPTLRSEGRRLRAALHALLSKYGKHGHRGRGDFWIEADNLGLWEQLVHVFRIDLITPDLADQLRAILRTRFRRWKIWIVLDVRRDGAGRTGEIVVRADRVEAYWHVPELMRVFGNAFTWGDHGIGPSGSKNTYWEIRATEWRQLQRELKSLLAAAAKSTKFNLEDGAGYWIDQHDCGWWTVGVAFLGPKLMTPRLAVQIRNLLRRKFRDWSVALRLETESEDPTAPFEGVMVFPDRAEEHWDPRELARRFGDEFNWPSGAGHAPIGRRRSATNSPA